jgi:hypothetical protein
VLCCLERRREGGRGWQGKVPRSPAAHKEKRGEKQADRKVPDRPVVVKGYKKKSGIFLVHAIGKNVFVINVIIKKVNITGLTTKINTLLK